MFCRFQHPTLRLLPAGATVAGWVIFLPLDQRALFTAHEKVGLGRSPAQVGILRLLEKSERLRVEPSLTKIFGWIVVSTLTPVFRPKSRGR